MTTYGYAQQPGTLPGLANPVATLGPDAHRFSAGLRCVVDASSGSATGLEWSRRLARAPGIRKDARAWYGLEEILSSQPDRRLDAGDLHQMIDLREFTLEAGWSDEVPDTLVVTMPVNPASQAEFCSVHEPSIRNVLLHVTFGNLDGSLGDVVSIQELQSDWQQEAVLSGRHADPFGVKRERETRRLEIEDRVSCLVDILALDPVAGTEFMDALAMPDTLRHKDEARRRWLWLRLRELSEGEIDIPGLGDATAARVATVLAAFGERADDYRKGPQGTSVPPAPFQSDWPRLGLALALAVAGATRDADGSHRFSRVQLASGDEVAVRSRADEPVTWANWSTDPVSGMVSISVETSDENGNGATRPIVRGTPDELDAHDNMPGVCRQVADRVRSGETEGTLDSDLLEASWAEGDEDIIWRNAPLRRFYDNHLPRELREVARELGAGRTVDGTCMTDALRDQLAIRFGTGLDADMQHLDCPGPG